MTNTRTKRRQRTLKTTSYVITFIFVIAIMFANCLRNIENEQNATEEISYPSCYISEYEIEQTKLWLSAEDISCVNSQPIFVHEEIVELPWYTEKEYELLCKLVHAESGRSNEKEMISIAATVLNRLEYEKFPNDIEAVIFEEGQFSPAINGEIYWFPEADKMEILQYQDVTKEVKKAVERALNGEDPTEIMVKDGALFYYSDKYISDEERAKRDNRISENIKYDETIFYRNYIN